MTVQGATSDAYLLVSCIALGIQSWALAHLQARKEQLIRTGLHRTAVCRVIGAAIYVYIGINAIWIKEAVLVTAFIAFALIQIMYMLNARADVRLKRKLTAYDARHGK
jgi:hypothetical protein